MTFLHSRKHDALVPKRHHLTTRNKNLLTQQVSQGPEQKRGCRNLQSWPHGILKDLISRRMSALWQSACMIRVDAIAIGRPLCSLSSTVAACSFARPWNRTGVCHNVTPPPLSLTVSSTLNHWSANFLLHLSPFNYIPITLCIILAVLSCPEGSWR